MAFAVVSQRFGAKVLPRKVEPRPKVRKTKNGTWMTEEKLQQVERFISDDAPSTSGSMMQDMLQAKQSRFLSSSTPSSREGQGLPSGFEGSMTRRVRVDTTLMASMACERPWHCPDKFLLDRAWFVLKGEENTEVVSQQHREAGVLKAVYPCLSSIPFSPVEPEEKCKDVDDSLTPCIPLVHVEDEENFEEDSSLGYSMSGPWGATDPNSCELEQSKISSVCCQPDTNGIKESGLHGIACADAPKHWQGLVNLNNADLDIAAAAAAAYAAVKPLDGSSNIDQELLFEILSTPVFLKSLISKEHPKKQIQESLMATSNNMLANENHVSNESSCISRSLFPAFQGCPNSLTHLSRNVWHQGARRT